MVATAGQAPSSELFDDLFDRGDLTGAATLAIKTYGRGILGYLTAILRDDGDAAEVFSVFAEDLWKGIGGFRRACSVKTWAYKLAWHAAVRFLKSPHRRRVRRLRTSEASKLADEVRSASGPRRAARESRFDELRATLEPEEQALLILRLDRKLAWVEVAEVLSGDGAAIDAATVRKRYERLKLRLRARLDELPAAGGRPR